jgi:hypothetical protein
MLSATSQVNQAYHPASLAYLVADLNHLVSGLKRPDRLQDLVKPLVSLRGVLFGHPMNLAQVVNMVLEYNQVFGAEYETGSLLLDSLRQRVSMLKVVGGDVHVSVVALQSIAKDFGDFETTSDVILDGVLRLYSSFPGSTPKSIARVLHTLHVSFPDANFRALSGGLAKLGTVARGVPLIDLALGFKVLSGVAASGAGFEGLASNFVRSGIPFPKWAREDRANFKKNGPGSGDLGSASANAQAGVGAKALALQAYPAHSRTNGEAEVTISYVAVGSLLAFGVLFAAYLVGPVVCSAVMDRCDRAEKTPFFSKSSDPLNMDMQSFGIVGGSSI